MRSRSCSAFLAVASAAATSASAASGLLVGGVDLGRGLRQPALGRGLGRLGRVEGHLVIARIDLEQHVSLVDQLVVVDRSAASRSRRPSADICTAWPSMNASSVDSYLPRVEPPGDAAGDQQHGHDRDRQEQPRALPERLGRLLLPLLVFADVRLALVAGFRLGGVLPLGGATGKERLLLFVGLGYSFVVGRIGWRGFT